MKKEKILPFYQIAIFTIALILIVLNLRYLSSVSDWIGVFILLVMAFVLECMVIELPDGSNISGGFIIALALIAGVKSDAGPLLGAFVGLLGPFIRAVLKKSKALHTIIFQAGDNSISLFIAGLLYYSIVPKGDAKQGLIASGFIAGLVVFQIVHSLISSIIYEIIKGNFKISTFTMVIQWEITIRLILSPISYMVIVYQSKWDIIGALILFFPVILGYYSIVGYISNAKKSKILNDKENELQSFKRMEQDVISGLNKENFYDEFFSSFKELINYLSCGVIIRKKGKPLERYITGNNLLWTDALAEKSIKLLETDKIKDKEPIILNDISKETPILMLNESAKSQIYFPLAIAGTNVDGVFIVESNEPNFFHDRNLSLVSLVSAQLSLVLSKQILEEQVSFRDNLLMKHSKRLVDIITIGEVLRETAEELDYTIMLDNVAKTINDSLGFRQVYINILDVEKGTFDNKIYIGKEPSPFEKSIPEHIVKSVFQEQHRICNSYLIAWGENSALPVHLTSDDNVWKENNRLIVPLFSSKTSSAEKSKNSIMGIISVTDPQDGKIPGEETIKTLEIFAGQTVSALENVQLHSKLAIEKKREEQAAQDWQTLSQLSLLLSSTLNLHDILSHIVGYFIQITNTDFGRIVTFDEYTGDITNEISMSRSGKLIEPKTANLIRDIENQAIEIVKKTTKPLIVTDATKDTKGLNPASIKASGIVSLLAFPLKLENRIQSIVIANTSKKLDFNLTILYILAAQSAMAIDNAQLHDKFQRLAITDGLTGVYNHRYFQERLDEEIARSARHSRPVSLIILDIDHFKTYNDKNGHPKGDEVLKTVCSLIQKTIRKVDILARYGGEEFVVILPETSLNDAVATAERIRKRIEENKFPKGETQPGGKVSVSLGVATCPDNASNKSMLISLADQALYEAKQRGRNQVRYAGEKYMKVAGAK